VQVQMLASVLATAWLPLTSLLAPTAKWSLHWAMAISSVKRTETQLSLE
jgi:hypothetical protein